MNRATRPLTLVFLYFCVTAKVAGEALPYSDGSITQPNESVNISEYQMELTLQTNITLPVDTVSVGNVMVFVYDVDGLGGRLISRPADTSGISQASPRAQMVRQLKLEEANITLASKLTQNPTTNRSQVGLEFKIRLSRSTLNRHFFVIRKVLFVVTSYGKLGEADDHQNDQLFSIFYTKSGTAMPVSTATPSIASIPLNIVTSQNNETTNKPTATDATTSVLPFASTNTSVQNTITKKYSTTMVEVVPSPLALSTVSASAQRTVTLPISVTPTFVSFKMSPKVHNTVNPSNTVSTPSPGGQGMSDNPLIRGAGVSTIFIVVPFLISIIWWLGTTTFSLWKRQQERNLLMNNR